MLKKRACRHHGMGNKSSVGPKSFLDRLPKEVIQKEILCKLNPRSVINLGSTSKSIRSIMVSEFREATSFSTMLREVMQRDLCTHKRLCADLFQNGYVSFRYCCDWFAISVTNSLVYPHRMLRLWNGKTLKISYATDQEINKIFEAFLKEDICSRLDKSRELQTFSKGHIIVEWTLSQRPRSLSWLKDLRGLSYSRWFDGNVNVNTTYLDGIFD